MIKSFRTGRAADIYHGIVSKQSRELPHELHVKARRLLDQLNVSTKLETLRIPPGNRLKALKGKLKGLYSLRINDQWCVIFRWSNGFASEVDIVDYH